jgi:drug/metabolite transporter (DMT)-like permease
MPYFRVILALIASVAIISSASILIKLAEAPVLIIAAYRLGIAALVLAPLTLTLRRHHLQALSGRDWLIAAVAGSFLGLHFITWIGSLEYTSVASSVVLVTINPIFVGLGMVVIFRERLHPLLVWGIALSVTGGILIGYSDFHVEGQALFGDLLALLGAVFHSAYLLLGQRLRRRLDLLPYITVVYGMAALLVLLAALVTQQSFTGYAPATYLFMLLLALGPQLLGHTAYNWTLRYVSAAVVAVAILGEPVGASILAYFILNEHLTYLQIGGGGLVLAGIYLALRAQKRA